jgi:predicted permease
MLEDLDQDIRDHIERETRDNIDRGMPPEEARYAALRKFGNVRRVKEHARDVWTLVWLEQLLQDVRYGLRSLRKSPGFTAVAVLTLALGIGANTAIFSLIDAVMLRSLPVENPSQLVLLKWSARKAPKIHGYLSSGDCIVSDTSCDAPNPSGCSFSEPMFREIDQAGVFSRAAAFSNAGLLDMTGNGPASTVTGQVVSGDFFRSLGVKAVLGRVIETSDDTPSSTSIAVLNYGFWQSAFGGSRDVIGRAIQLNGVPFTIVGVADQHFIGLTPGSDYDVWLPITDEQRIRDPLRWHQDRVTFWWLSIVGRLKPEVSLQQAQATISRIFRNEMVNGSVPIFEAGGGGRPPEGPAPGSGLAGRQVTSRARLASGADTQSAKIQARASSGPKGTKTDNGPAPESVPPGETALSTPSDEPAVTLLGAQTGLTGSRGRYADPLYILMLAVGIILLIACANVAGLMLVRSTTRSKEIAVRLALGAGRTRIVCQLLTESVMLSALGGAAGIPLAYWCTHFIVSFVSNNQTRPIGFVVGVDMGVLAFTAAVSILTGVLFGIAPSFRGAYVDFTPALKEGCTVSLNVSNRGVKWFTVGNALVIAQVALAIVVLVSAGLLVRTLQNLRSIDVGFDSHNMVIFQLDPTLVGYKFEDLDGFYRDLQGRLAATPGVTSVSYSAIPLLSGHFEITGFHWPQASPGRESEAFMLPVGPDFFNTMQIPFLEGRGFNASDYVLAASNSAPIPVIVNQAFVVKYLGEEKDPRGKLFGQSVGDANSPQSSGYQIIGVVRDARYSNLRQEIGPTMYAPQRAGGAAFELRTRADLRALLPAIRRVVAQVNPNLPLFNITTESQQIDRLLFRERLVARLSAFFGLLALVLACIGLYGLLSYEVARRTREIGIRMALGAKVRDVLRLVVGQGIALVVLGVTLGIGLALGVTRYLVSILYGVQTNDPLTIVAAIALLALVTFAACYIPARRAMRVDPMVALRHE